MNGRVRTVVWRGRRVTAAPIPIKLPSLDRPLTFPNPSSSRLNGQDGDISIVAEKGIDHGAVRIGQTYDIHFSNAMKSYTLVFRTFTGQEILMTPGVGSDHVDASQLENTSSFKRITVALKAPREHSKGV